MNDDVIVRREVYDHISATVLQTVTLKAAHRNSFYEFIALMFKPFYGL